MEAPRFCSLAHPRTAARRRVVPAPKNKALVWVCVAVFDPIVEGGEPGADVFGVILFLSGSAGNYGYGTWAATG